ncbi:hypothetical protein MSG28_006451 [Choristoneura fumiferana]|uniref:Uncharacterized protein n=1 Tax=Choristoneura fumiferana TaxID=7141 RepID=A0ACC0JEZ9_CHOFU|nr:hypothetical protein MSG28_006451 [Choristoneura fumiferana]
MDNAQLFQDFMGKMKIEMSNQTKEIISKMDDKLLPLITEIKELKAENTKLREKIVDVEKFKRKNNIIIHGLKEENERSSSELLATIIGKIKNDLNVSLENRDIDIIHRIGKKENNQVKVRPILISFVNGWKKNEIMVNKKKFNDGYISEDYPKEVLLKRRDLQKELVHERNKGNFAVIKYDKLIVKEGQGYFDDQMAKWLKNLTTKRQVPCSIPDPGQIFVLNNTNVCSRVLDVASQVESKLETQSLPGHSVMATQTECHIGTQTEPEINKPTRRKARSDNDSYSEDDSEMIVEDDTAKVAWVKRRKPKKKLKYKDPRRSMRVYDVKRKIKTPIIEESEISPSLESEKHVKISKTNEREEHVKNYGDITKSTVTTSKNETVSSTRIKMSESDRKSGLRKELLMEISDSLDEK